MTAIVPEGLVAPKASKPPPDPSDKMAGPTASPIKVTKIKVGSAFDQRKRELRDWQSGDLLTAPPK